MAGRALLDGPALDFLANRLPGMNAPVTVHAAEILLKIVKTGAVFLGNLLVARTAGNRRGLVLTCHVTVQVPDIRVAATAAVVAVNRGGKGRLELWVIMAALAGPGDSRIGGRIKGAQIKRKCQKQDFSEWRGVFHMPHLPFLFSFAAFHAAMPPKSRFTSRNPL